MQWMSKCSSTNNFEVPLDSLIMGKTAPVKCENCKYSSITLVPKNTMTGTEYATGLVCKLGYKIGPGGVPLEDCPFEPK